MAEPGTVFVANVCSTSTTAATAITDVGKTYGIYEDTNGNWCIDKGDTANSRVIIENYVRNPDAVGDTSGRLYFRFMGKFCQLHITS